MIANIRLDIGMDELCAILAGGPDAGCMPLYGPRKAHGGDRVVLAISRAREGLSWVLARCGVGPGDEVLVTDLMCDTAGDAVRATGARLVTYGLIPGSFKPSPEACGRAVSNRTRALIVPHLYGIPADMGSFATLAGRHGLLLIEDSALVIPTEEGALEHYQTPAGCVVYSFNYGKPLAAGWGGAVSLSSSLAARVGRPGIVAMNADDDRFYAAALLVGHVTSDSTRLIGSARLSDAVIQADIGLHLLVAKGGGRRPAVPDRAAVDEVFAAAMKGSDAVRAWCDSRAARVRPAFGVRLPPEIDSLLRRAHRAAAGLDPAGLTSTVLTAAGLTAASRRGAAAAESGPMESLRPGGYVERLLEVQRRALAGGSGSRSRRGLAAFYAAGLDAERWIFPAADEAGYWLSYPVAAKQPLGRGRLSRGCAARDRLARRIAARLGVDAYPYVWPDVLHRIPGLQGAVAAGPDFADGARLVDGLLNLPVHGQMTVEKAEALVEMLNAEG